MVLVGRVLHTRPTAAAANVNETSPYTLSCEQRAATTVEVDSLVQMGVNKISGRYYEILPGRGNCSTQHPFCSTHTPMQMRSQQTLAGPGRGVGADRSHPLGRNNRAAERGAESRLPRLLQREALSGPGTPGFSSRAGAQETKQASPDNGLSPSSDRFLTCSSQSSKKISKTKHKAVKNANGKKRKENSAWLRIYIF